MSLLEPGRGYAEHVDDYDVAIFVQSGRVETLGREAGPGSLIYYPSGEPHGMRNAGAEPARYITFEFHGRRAAPWVHQPAPLLAAE
jgi:quercetin dioxygenase-like cupin family protein